MNSTSGNKNFYTGLFLLLLTLALLSFQVCFFSGFYPLGLPDNKAVKAYRQQVSLFKLSDACQYDIFDAMMILSVYYKREKEFAASRSWLLLAAEKGKSPLAMLLLAKDYERDGKKSLAFSWYSKAIHNDSRLSSSEVQAFFEKKISDRVQKLYEK